MKQLKNKNMHGWVKCVLVKVEETNLKNKLA